MRPRRPRRKPGDAVWVALRPEKIRIAPRCAAGERRTASLARSLDIGYRGDFSVYKVRLDGGFVMKAAVANMTRLIERPIGVGDRVWLSWAPDAGVVLTQ